MSTRQQYQPPPTPHRAPGSTEHTGPALTILRDQTNLTPSSERSETEHAPFAARGGGGGGGGRGRPGGPGAAAAPGRAHSGGG
ncbi:hypothetical protein, partial [Nocardia abscessus]|uniref:hypothetical protein n=1 Tax=Nocardia abscessus TaxID=120957 RepID=UPI002454BA60